MSTKRLALDGLETALTDRGSGPPVLFLHGVPESRTGWDHIIDQLAGDHRCVAPDLPGFGGSPMPPKSFDWSVSSWQAWARALLDAAGLDEPVVIVAHDVGGVPGCAIAAAEPERCKAVILTNTIIHEDYRWHRMARVWATPLMGELLMLGMIRPAFVSSMKNDAPGLDRAVADRIFDHIGTTTKRAILRWYRRMTKPTYFDGLAGRFQDATVRVPTRVLWGRRDHYIPIEFAHRFGGEVSVVDDAGHWLPLEKPELVINAVREGTRR